MNRAIITGATGFIGEYLVKELNRHGVEFWTVVRPDSKNKEKVMTSPRAHIVECTLDNIEMLPRLVSERGFDVFFHLAWEGATGEGRRNPSLQCDNVKWAEKCAVVAKKMKCERAVFTGTVCEMQVDEIINQKEFCSNAYYLMSKLQAKNVIEVTSKRIGLKTVWCRFYHPIGVNNKKEQLIANTIYKLLRGEIPVFGEGKEWFDVIDVSDLARSLYIMGDSNLKENTYYVGSGMPRRLKEYLEIIGQMVNPDIKLGFGKRVAKSLFMDKNWLDDQKFREETGFENKYEFVESITNMKEWLS